MMPAQSVDQPPDRVATQARIRRADEIATSRMPKLFRVAAGPARGMGLSQLGIDCLQRMVSAPELLLASVNTWLKNDADRRVALIAADAGSAEETWCCKEAINRNWWVRFISRFRSVRAWNAFEQGLLLCQYQISTPQPLAVVTVTRSRTYSEYLVTAAVPGAISLHHWLHDHSHCGLQGDSRRPRTALARQLGEQLQRLHQHRFDHRDLKPTNILLDLHDQIYLIDLDGVRRWPLLPRFRRVQNLARMWAGLGGSRQVTATDALRFLFAYLPPEQRGDWKTLWRQVKRRSARMLDRRHVKRVET